MRSVWRRLSLVVVSLVAIGCGSMNSPTAPTRALPQQSAVETTQVSATFQTQALEDSSLNGSGYLLDSVSITSMTFHNNQNSYTAVYDGTTFRRAVLQSWSPGDPYYSYAVAYNAGDPLGDTWLGILQDLEGGNVRIVLVPPNPIFPNDPIRIASFQPIP